MSSQFDSATSKKFVQIAVERELITEDQAKTLIDQSTEQSVMSTRLAVEAGLLKPVEVEIVQAFAAPLDLAPGYELLDVLGHGALGVVYRARQPRLQRDVAVKAIMESRLTQTNVVARFQQEGAAIGRLQHPNIVSAYDSGSHHGRLYLVMELVHGIDLRRTLDEGPMTVDTALSVLRQAASGLSHALAHQIIHRDIKPGNIILTEAPAGFDLPPGVPLAKIADFGLARLTQSAETEDQDTRLTLTGAALGTPMYCAPEQLTGDEIDHRCDIYALGATFFRALSGEPPFEPGKMSKVIAAKVTGQPPRMELLPKDLDPNVHQLLVDMMHPDPEDRIPDYETLIDRIDQIQAPPSSRTSSRPPRSRSLKRLIGPAAALAMLAVVMIPLLSGAFRSPPQPTMVPSGGEAYLFDGKTVTGWTARNGLWKGDTDSEGGAVLAGKGSAVRPFPATIEPVTGGGIGMRVGIDLGKSESAEVHFGFPSNDYALGWRNVARFTPDQALIGRRDGVDGLLEPEGTPRALKSHETDGPHYHEFRIEHQNDHWFVFLDGDLLGHLPADAAADNRAMQLVAADGLVHFESPSVFGLTAKEPTGE